ncbi:MAG: bacteriohemerythrin [Rhodocyclaceae bacterium]|nr:bacteriohemerythrin [Rhodocyclaceae bacterium]
MSTFEWQDILSVGCDVIDSQHKQIFDIVNELCDGVRRNHGASVEMTRKSLAALCAYTRNHFAEEERLMQAAEYPDFERHKQAHDQLVARIVEFEARLRAGGVKDANEVLPFLVGEWLSHHIAFEDQQYAGYLKRYLGRERARLRLWRCQSVEAVG